jgi:hypothetical protein
MEHLWFADGPVMSVPFVYSEREHLHVADTHFYLRRCKTNH